MTGRLTRDEVAKVALLGRLKLSADELDRMTDPVGPHPRIRRDPERGRHRKRRADGPRHRTSWTSFGRMSRSVADAGRRVGQRPEDRRPLFPGAANPRRRITNRTAHVPRAGRIRTKTACRARSSGPPPRSFSQEWRRANGRPSTSRRPFSTRSRRTTSAIKAFLHVDRAEALRQAEAVEQKRRQGQPLGRLAGLPVALKDVVCTHGQPTTCAQPHPRELRPPYDAEIVRRLREADAVLIGKTNMDEFAMGSSTENSAFQTTRNPWDTERAPGGSSGGSAAAVAAGMAPLAIGSDTGGSIRQPAGFCGVVGMKPTYGRVSRFGLVAFASSLDQFGPLANDVAGAAMLLEVIAGHDPCDSTSVDRPGAGLQPDGRAAAGRAANRSCPPSISPRDSIPRSTAVVAGGGRPVSNRWAPSRRRDAAALEVFGRHVLPHRPLRGGQQPGPLRRRPLRPSGGALRRPDRHVRRRRAAKALGPK